MDDRNIFVCKRCGSHDVRKNGFNAKGRQQLKCNGCTYQWLMPVGYQEPLDTTKAKECPRCGCVLLNKDGRMGNAQRMVCLQCHYHWAIRPPRKRQGVECVHCGKPTKKAGMHRGKQRCFCTDCRKYLLIHPLLLAEPKFYWDED
jgi:transposase-like protein